MPQEVPDYRNGKKSAYRIWKCVKTGFSVFSGWVQVFGKNTSTDVCAGGGVAAALCRATAAGKPGAVPVICTLGHSASPLEYIAYRNAITGQAG